MGTVFFRSMSLTVTFLAGGGTVAGGVSEEVVGEEVAGSSLREFRREVPGFEEGRGDSLVG